MSLVQLPVDVSDFDAAVAFYSRLFGTVPAKLWQDKVWAHDSDGLAWVYYTVLEHIETP